MQDGVRRQSGREWDRDVDVFNYLYRDSWDGFRICRYV